LSPRVYRLLATTAHSTRNLARCRSSTGRSQLKYHARNRPVEAIRACSRRPPVSRKLTPRARAPRRQPKPNHAKRARSGVIYPVGGGLNLLLRRSPYSDLSAVAARDSGSFLAAPGRLHEQCRMPLPTPAHKVRFFTSHTGATMALQCPGSLPATGARL
jgi:hypothetical protein